MGLGRAEIGSQVWRSCNSVASTLRCEPAKDAGSAVGMTIVKRERECDGIGRRKDNAETQSAQRGAEEAQPAKG